MAEPVYALVDCNSFYASCERVFRPDLLRTLTSSAPSKLWLR